MKLFLIVIVLLATASLGLALRVIYAAGYNQGLGGNPGNTRLAQEIDNGNGPKLIENMKTWSDDKFECKESKLPNTISCKPNKNVETKAEASQEIQNMRELVCKKLKECKAATPE